MLRLSLVFFILSAVPPVTARSQPESTPSPCASPGAAEFDFWLGDWSATWVDSEGKQISGTNHINRILDGCVIHEDFSAPVLAGKSYSVFDPVRGVWRQTWVDNQGGYLDFTGVFRDGKMILSRTANRDGQNFLQRMVWYNISAEEFDWNWERSDDEGKSWNLQWHIHYRRDDG